MKVLFLTHWFPTEETPQKGVFILEQAKALRSVGAEVTVLHIHIGPGKGPLRASTCSGEWDGISVFTVHLTGWLWKLIYTIYPIQLLLIRRAVHKSGFSISDFDLLHAHVIHPAGAIGHRLAQEHRLPFYISEHWSNLEYYFDKNLFRSWGKKAYDHAKKIFVVSEFLKKRMAQFVTDPDKVEVIPNVVSGTEFRYRPGPIGSSYHFVMAASWNTGKRIIKRPKLVIKAVAEASKELDRPVILSIIGDGDRIPELKKFCARNQVHAQFHGFVSKKTIADQFQKADLFLHASEYETFSVVIAEALKCGTPVVASNVAAIPELVNPSNGILVENKLTPWKNAILQAIARKYDKQAIAEQQKNRFGYTDVGNRLLNAYRG